MIIIITFSMIKKNVNSSHIAMIITVKICLSIQFSQPWFYDN